MSPLFVTTESRERSAPGDPVANRKWSDRLFELAGQIEDLQNELTEDLSFEDYDALRETEAKLLAFRNLLMTSDMEAFLEEEIRSAGELLKSMRPSRE